MCYGTCCIIYSCSFSCNCSIAFYRHIVITTYFDIVITTRVYVYLTIYCNNVYITYQLVCLRCPLFLLVYRSCCFGVCFVYVNLMAASIVISESPCICTCSLLLNKRKDWLYNFYFVAIFVYFVGCSCSMSFVYSFIACVVSSNSLI